MTSRIKRIEKKVETSRDLKLEYIRQRAMITDGILSYGAVDTLVASFKHNLLESFNWKEELESVARGVQSG